MAEKYTDDQLPPEILLARDHLIAYAILQFPKFQPAKHHVMIANKLEAVERGDIKRLMIFAPPRHGKSLLTSKLFPSWYFGRNPSKDFIFTSYSQDLADDCGRATKTFIDTEIHSLAFPDSAISRDSASIRRFHLTAGGGYNCAGVGGPITGRGGNVLMIDDPYKNREEAESDNNNRILQEWYTSTFYTRAQTEDGKLAPIVIILTRWTEKGIEQWILDKLAEQRLEDPTLPEWEILSLPALCEEPDIDPLGRKYGEALWPERYPVEVLTQIKRDIGSRDWNALYQQRPTSTEGEIFKRDWWKYYKTLPDDLEIIIQTWDTSFTNADTSDYVVGIVMGRKGPNVYLIDLIRQRLNYGQTVNAILDMTLKHPRTYKKFIENKANGPAIISSLQNKIPGIIPVNPENRGSKEARWNGASGAVQSGNVYLPEGAPWVDSFIDELAACPDGKFDDQADAFSQGCLELIGDRSASIIEYYKRLVEGRGYARETNVA